MKNMLKRWGMALVLLTFVVLLMLFGTYGVTKLGEKMFEGTGVEIKPEGENLLK